MGFEAIVKIFVFLLGTALQIAILSLMVKRKGTKRRELVFAFFTFSVLSWTFGIFISLFCGYIYRGENIIEKSFGAFAIFSFPLIFPLFLHSLLVFIEQKNFAVHPALKYALLPAIYLPTLLFVRHLWQSIHKLTPVLQTMDSFITNFFPWAFVPLIISWYLIVRLCRKIADQEEKKFLGMVGWGTTLVICCYFFTFVLGGRTLSFVGPYLVLLTEAITFLLPPMLAYYLYYYNYMEYVLNRGSTYCVLGIFVIAFYLSVIRPMGEGMEKKLQINFRMVEGILVMGLVFFFDPLKRAIQEVSNRIFFKERKYYRKVFSDISLMVNQDTHSGLETLLDYVAFTIHRAMKIREVSFILFERDKEQIKIKESTTFVLPEDIVHIVDYIEQQRVSVLNIYGLEEKTEILREMRKIKAFTIIPIYDESKLIGIFNVGKRRIRHQLLAEEEEMLIMLLNQIVTAIKNTRLAREKFAMERKMYENDKLSSLGRLSASIAHEVKNPLSSIKTITQVMKEDLPKNDPNQEGLSLVVEEIDRLSRVVKQLLLFARPHTGTLTKVRLNEVLNNVLLLLRHEAERNRVTIHNKMEGSEIWLVSDKDALSEIFFNLIHNGIQAIPEGGTVSIEHKIETPDNREDHPRLKIYVSDNGPGIAPSERDKMFEPFYTTKQTGTGLGLTIVKNRLQKLRGDIRICEGRPGAVFEVDLPLPSIEENHVAEKANTYREHDHKA